VETTAAALMAKSTAAAAAANARTTTAADDPSAEATGSEPRFRNSEASSRSLTRYEYGSTGSYRTETDACSDADPDAYVSGSDSASAAFVSAPGIVSLPATFPSTK
jgi:hypothetical protein